MWEERNVLIVRPQIHWEREDIRVVVGVVLFTPLQDG